MLEHGTTHGGYARRKHGPTGRRSRNGKHRFFFFFFYNFEFLFVNRRKLSSDVKDMMFFEFKTNISQKIKTYKNFEKVCILSQTVSSGVTRQFFPKPIIGGGGSSRG